MKRISILALVCIFAFSSVLFAQTRGGTGQRMQRAPDVQLLEKDSTAKFLALTDDQKKTVFPEIDALIKIYAPYKQEAETLAVKMGLPIEVVTGGMTAMYAGGMRGGMDREARTAMQATYTKFDTENRKILKKYEPQEKDLLTHIGNIEKLLTDEQKTKYNYVRPAGGMGGRGAGVQRQPAQPQLSKPTFIPQPPRSIR